MDNKVISTSKLFEELKSARRRALTASEAISHLSRLPYNQKVEYAITLIKEVWLESKNDMDCIQQELSERTCNR